MLRVDAEERVIDGRLVPVMVELDVPEMVELDVPVMAELDVPVMVELGVPVMVELDVPVCDAEPVAEDEPVLDGGVPNAYNLLSYDPTYTVPSLPMAGDEYTTWPVV